MAAIAQEEQAQQAASHCREVKSDLQERTDRSSPVELEHLYVTYRSRVWSLCLRMTGNTDEAEDLTQETFLRLSQKLDTFRGESTFYTWLRRLTINVVLLRLQSASWRRETSMEALTCPDPITGCPRKQVLCHTDSRLSEMADRIDLQRALDQLPPGFKTVLILHDIEGYEHVEISRLIGCSIGTSKSQLHKARLKMREFLRRRPGKQFRHRRLEVRGKPYNSGDVMKQPVLQFLPPVLQECAASTSAAA